jgi:hypothetical protein
MFDWNPRYSDEQRAVGYEADYIRAARKQAMVERRALRPDSDSLAVRLVINGHGVF